MASTLIQDANGHIAQVFAPTKVLLAQTTIDTSANKILAILPTTATNVKLDGSASFVAWPLGVTLGMHHINSVEFESATDVFIME